MPMSPIFMLIRGGLHSGSRSLDHNGVVPQWSSMVCARCQGNMGRDQLQRFNVTVSSFVCVGYFHLARQSRHTAPALESQKVTFRRSRQVRKHQNRV